MKDAKERSSMAQKGGRERRDERQSSSMAGATKGATVMFGAKER